MSTLSLFQSPTRELVDSTDLQNTPRDLALDLGWFDVDVCTNPAAHILARRKVMLELGQDGRTDDWTHDGAAGLVWCNGEYSNPLPWCERLRAHRGPWASLWKLDTTTTWWRELMASGATWAPFRERIGFERAGQTAKANFVSVLVWKDWQPSAAVLSRLWKPRSEQ